MIKISEEMQAEIERRMKEGRYENPDQLLAASFAALDDDYEEDIEAVRAAVNRAREQLARGERVPAEDVYKELLARNRTAQTDP